METPDITPRELTTRDIAPLMKAIGTTIRELRVELRDGQNKRIDALEGGCSLSSSR